MSPNYDFVSIITIFLHVFIVPFISCEHKYSDTEDMADAPYEQVYFRIEHGMSFHPSLKYPPYRRCVLPAHLTKQNFKGDQQPGQGSSSKTWRLYWSTAAWSAYFYENGNELANWELEKENPDRTASSWHHYFVPLLIMIIWIIIAGWSCLFIFPILSMILFRIMYLIWEFITHKFFIGVCRWIVIKIERSKRDHILRVFKNAGHRPPVYRYSLPKFLRRDPSDRTPIELDESEEEYWSSDDELNNMGKAFEQDRNNDTVYTPTPEFVPEYPAEVAEKSQLLSQEMFAYLKKVKRYGMFAVWAEGTKDMDLAGISKNPNQQLFSKRMSTK